MWRLAFASILLTACATETTADDAGAPDASDATAWYDAGPCGSGSDSGCGCGMPPPVFDAGETLAGDLALFDGAAPDGACPPLTFGVGWDGGQMAGAVLYRGCKNTTLWVTPSCASAGDWLVFDKGGNIAGATQMSGGSCRRTGPNPDYLPCGADAATYPYPCEVLCGSCNTGCAVPPPSDAGVTDGGAE